MKLLLHDLDPHKFQELFPTISKEIEKVGPEEGGTLPHTCIGCFSCWTKTPGHCIIQDGYGDLSVRMGAASELIILSRITFGGYSPFIKTLLDRSIGYILPYFCTRQNEMHHKLRYSSPFQLKVWGYGDDIEKEELDTMKTLIKANALNHGAASFEFHFLPSLDEAQNLKEALL